MHIDIQGMVIAAFFSLGGAGLVLKALDKYRPQAIASVVHWALSAFPKAKDFVIAHHQRIDAEIDASAADVKNALDESIKDAPKP